jgi:transposase-like protein
MNKKTKSDFRVSKQPVASKLVNEMLDAGLSLMDIAKAVNVSYFTVRRWWHGATREPMPLQLENLKKVHASVTNKK